MAVRREKVILDLDDKFSGPMTRAAAAARLLKRELGDLDSSTQGVDESSTDASRSVSDLGGSSRKTERDIDRFSGRLRLFADAAAALGPALSPIGAAAVPGVAAMAAQLTFTGIAAGSALLAFHGLGDGLKALNEYQLDPSADNLAKMREEMAKLGPDGAHFVRFLDGLGPQLRELQMTARGGIFPGVEDGLTAMLDLLPQVNDIVGSVSETMGTLAREAGEGLAGERFEAFFDYLESDASPILYQMGHAIGNVGEGLANLLVAFRPATQDFSSGLLGMTEDFAEWSRTLDQNESFQNFLDYAREAGPKVVDLLGSLINAFAEIAEAAAPVGDVVLPVLTKLLDLVAAVAGSQAGTALVAAAAGMAAFSRATQAFDAAKASSLVSFIGKAKDGASAGASLSRLGAGVGAVALSMTDIDEKAGVSNTAMGALMGTMLLPGWGTAAGAIVGGFVDMQNAIEDTETAIDSAYDAMRNNDLAGLTDARRTIQGELANNWGPDFLNIPNPKTFGLEAALAGIDDAMGGVRSHAGGLGDLLKGPLANGFEAAAQSADEFRDAVNGAFALLDKRAALRAAREALREFNKTLRDAPDEMHKGGPAYDQVEEALDGIAQSSLEAAEHLRGMGRVNFLDKQRNKFIQAARQMGLTAKQARNLADDLHLLDKSDAKPKVDADTRAARRKIDEAGLWLAAFDKKTGEAKADADNRPAKNKVDEANRWLSVFGNRREIANIHVESDAAAIAAETNAILNNLPDEIVYLHTVRTGSGGQGAGYGGAAGGGTVPKSGRGYADRYPYLLADGEEVISNRYGQADRHRELLKAINSNRYADGGTVGRWSHPVATSSTRIVERVVERLPSNFTVNAPGLGRIVLQTVDARIADDHEYRRRMDDRD